MSETREAGVPRVGLDHDGNESPFARGEQLRQPADLLLVERAVQEGGHVDAHGGLLDQKNLEETATETTRRSEKGTSGNEIGCNAVKGEQITWQ